MAHLIDHIFVFLFVFHSNCGYIYHYWDISIYLWTGNLHDLKWPWTVLQFEYNNQKW